MVIEEALKKAESWINEIEGVVGVAQGKVGKDDCITVFLSIPEAAGEIPKSFHGYKICIEFTDGFNALQ